MKPLEALKKYFGFESFRKNQLEIITAILANENVIAVLPTGAGKSLCYQIPALVKENFSIVVSPLIALMKDQVDSLNTTTGLSAFINSTMEFYESEKVLQDIEFGKTKILYVAPERLENINFAERIKSLKPYYLFVDEAHCISEWGHNFRPSYRRIKEFAEFAGIKKISGFTATATPEVVDDIIEQLSLKNPQKFVRGFERENLHINAIVTKKKKEKCYELIRQFKTPAIIYTSSRKKAEEVCEYLNMNRVNCAYYHAGLQAIERKKIQDDFIGGKVPVIAATNAFGMGIDKKDIRLVIHYNTPGSIENYYQEIGRAGRDGNPSFTFLLHEDSDINIHKFFIANSNPDKELIQKVYDAICDFSKIALGSKPAEEIPVNLEFISGYCKRLIGKGLLNTILRILESGGYLKTLSEFNSSSNIQINIDKEKLKNYIKKSSNENISAVLLSLVREFGSEIFTSPIKLNLVRLAKRLDIIETDLENALITLDNLSIITYKKSLSKENIILTVPRIDSKRLVLDYKKINENFLLHQRKIESMVELVYSSDCRFKFILKYFGEDVSNYKCGKCDRCSSSGDLSDSSVDYLREIFLRTVGECGTTISENSIINILQGTEKDTAFMNVSTFGTCANYSKNDLRIILQSLVSSGNIYKDAGKKNRLNLIKDLDNKKSPDKLNATDIAQDYETNLELFNRLREVRSKAAKRFLQTGLVICPDVVLREIALQKPVSMSAMLKIKGFNQRMFNKAGKEFLEVINESKTLDNKNSNNFKNKEIPHNIRETHKLLLKGYSLNDIAELRKLSPAVISMQIESIIEYEPSVDISNLFGKNEYDMIDKELRKGITELKAIKDNLGGAVEYSKIRIAMAKFKFRESSVSSTLQDKR